MEKLTEYLKENKTVAYSFATSNTKYNKDGRPVISKNDEWADETEWDDLFQSLTSSRQRSK